MSTMTSIPLGIPSTNVSLTSTIPQTTPAISGVITSGSGNPPMSGSITGTNISTMKVMQPLNAPPVGSTDNQQVLNKQRLQDLVREVDVNEQLDDDVEEMLLQIADDFIENVVTNACLLAKHRKANTLEVKDVQLNLEKNWNIWIPGFGSDELRPYKKAAVTEAHKQRLALIRKTLKKY